MDADPGNPFKRMKEELGVDNVELGKILGISHSYAAKLCSGACVHVGWHRAQQIERRSNGRIRAREIVDPSLIAMFEEPAP